ncbi:hypothetical protein KX928_10460 [Roseobacter sp. YSTF-M11]|uniref:Uncharacterized protein n=2 Tax=Roseobacter insulae TaxID=2859783 RepID=A0A9X1FV75_9RHOB|nr:hypothetical protein [Roseobacter insulae]
MREIKKTSPVAFTSDGCSGGMSTVWRSTLRQFPQMARAQGDGPPWEDCCVAHDRQYHIAGGASDASESYAARLKADQALKSCVLAQGDRDMATQSEAYGIGENTLRVAYRGIAQAMFLAVRLGGGPCSGLSWRWGYGYPDCSAAFGEAPAPPIATHN